MLSSEMTTDWRENAAQNSSEMAIFRIRDAMANTAEAPSVSILGPFVGSLFPPIKNFQTELSVNHRMGAF